MGTVKRVVLGALLLEGCAHAATSPPLPPGTKAQLAKHVALNLTMLHLRLYGHGALPDHEWVRCLRAEWDGDIPQIIDSDDADIHAYSATRVTFGCMADLMATDAWGFWHPHLPTTTDKCAFSPDDIATQDSLRAPVMLLSCGTGPVQFIARVRPR